MFRLFLTRSRSPHRLDAPGGIHLCSLASRVVIDIISTGIANARVSQIKRRLFVRYMEAGRHSSCVPDSLTHSILGPDAPYRDRRPGTRAFDIDNPKRPASIAHIAHDTLIARVSFLRRCADLRGY